MRLPFRRYLFAALQKEGNYEFIFPDFIDLRNSALAMLKQNFYSVAEFVRLSVKLANQADVLTWPIAGRIRLRSKCSVSTLTVHCCGDWWNLSETEKSEKYKQVLLFFYCSFVVFLCWTRWSRRDIFRWKLYADNCCYYYCMLPLDFVTSWSSYICHHNMVGADWSEMDATKKEKW